MSETNWFRRTFLMGMDLALGPDKTVVQLLGKDAEHSGSIAEEVAGEAMEIAEEVRKIIGNGIALGESVGSIAEKLRIAQYLSDDGYRLATPIGFRQLVMAEFGISEADIRDSAIDYVAEARRRALRTMRNAEVSINGVVIGRVDEIQIEHTNSMYSYAVGRCIGTLRFVADTSALNEMYVKVAEAASDYGRGFFAPGKRSKKMAEPKPYEQKKIVALVYRAFPTVEEIEKMRHGSGSPPVATRDRDVQMHFVGYVYEGETAEQIIHEDIEKTAPIRVNEDRQYLVFANPEIHVAEGPKSRVTKVRTRSGFENTFTTDAPGKP